MKIAGRHVRRELWITLGIWVLLMAFAVSAIFLLRKNALRIIDHIHYVNVSRGAKASVLYAEAEKNAWKVLKKAEQLNRLSAKKYHVPADDKHLQRSLTLYNEALETDIRDEFSPERTMHYELLGQVYDAAGNRSDQILSHARALMSQRAFDDAMDFINLLRDADPVTPEPVILQAQLHDLNGETTRALEVMDDLYESYNVTPKARWVRGSILNKLGKNEEATAEWEQAVAGKPDSLKFRRDLAIILADTDQTDRAVEVMELGVEQGGRLDAAYMHVYGNFLMEVGNLNKAIDVLKQADELAPYSGDVQWSLAKAYHLDGQDRLAASTLRRATEIKPELHNRVF